VVVHPIVLLNAVDHYNRVARDTKRRVIGILLGEVSRVRDARPASRAARPPAPAISACSHALTCLLEPWLCCRARRERTI
jgi:hypothetical protein